MHSLHVFPKKTLKHGQSFYCEIYVQALRHLSTEKEVWSVLNFLRLSISSDLEIQRASQSCCPCVQRYSAGHDELKLVGVSE